MCVCVCECHVISFINLATCLHLFPASSHTLSCNPAPTASALPFRTPLAARGASTVSTVIPPQLQEHSITCRASEKPLLLLHLLSTLQMDRTLVFASSVETTTRLYKLLKLFGSLRVQCVSSARKSQENARTLAKFARGEVSVLVCSDTLARGIDLANVENVISYDCPARPKTYIHRCCLGCTRERECVCVRVNACVCVRESERECERECVCECEGVSESFIECAVRRSALISSFCCAFFCCVVVVRVGRAARAGAQGSAYTLVRPGEVGCCFFFCVCMCVCLQLVVVSLAAPLVLIVFSSPLSFCLCLSLSVSLSVSVCLSVSLLVKGWTLQTAPFAH